MVSCALQRVTVAGRFFCGLYPKVREHLTEFTQKHDLHLHVPVIPVKPLDGGLLGYFFIKQLAPVA